MNTYINLVERTLHRSYSHKGRFLTIRDDTVSLPFTGNAKREFVEHAGSVMIVPLLNEEIVIVERIFRYPVSDVLIELPAGMVEDNESTLECAGRELLEETGYSARSWALAGRFFNAPAYSSEFIDVWIARNLTFVGASANIQEPMEIVRMSFTALTQQARQGKLRDMRTAFATLVAEQILANGDSITWQSV